MKVDESGSALVETAVAMPIVLLLIFGAFQLLLIVSVRSLFEQAAYEGGRTLAVHDDPAKAAGRIDRVLAAVPRGAGFLESKPQANLKRKRGVASVTVRGELSLLPFFRQAARGLGGTGRLELSAVARARIEPWSP